MASDEARSWVERRTTTNLLLGTNTVVLAAGFVRVGSVGSWLMQSLSELILSLVLFTAVVLVLWKLFSYE